MRGMLFAPRAIRFKIYWCEKAMGFRLWQLDSTHDRLPMALERLNHDPERTFWQ